MSAVVTMVSTHQITTHECKRISTILCVRSHMNAKELVLRLIKLLSLSLVIGFNVTQKIIGYM